MSRSLADRASFRDPAGRVTDRDGVLTRWIAPEFVPTYRAVERSGLVEELHAADLLIAHREVCHATEIAAMGAVTGEVLLHPERVPFITYPYEWTPRQLRDAALLTLDVAARAYRRGQALRDASAFNVQFHRGRPILIDSLSFAPREPGAPWMAYGQFCRHFLGPLALATLVDPSLLRLAEQESDGVPVTLASETLGRRGLLRAGVLVHLHLHAVAERRAANGAANGAVRTGAAGASRISDRQFFNTIDGLRSTVEALPMPRGATPWVDYEGGAHYDAESRREKNEFVQSAVDWVRPRSLWDLGANQGDMAVRHLPVNGYAVAVDADLGCAEAIYARAHRDRFPIAPIWRDLRAPTPSSGWAAEERAALHERGPADLVLALALVHHLSLTGRVPLERIASWLGGFARHAVVEVPDADDPMVKRLSPGAPVIPSRFGGDAFRAAIAAHFDILAERRLTGLPRSLFLLARRTP